jgi:hypothetical protein
MSSDWAMIGHNPHTFNTMNVIGKPRSSRMLKKMYRFLQRAVIFEEPGIRQTDARQF